MNSYEYFVKQMFKSLKLHPLDIFEKSSYICKNFNTQLSSRLILDLFFNKNVYITFVIILGNPTPSTWTLLGETAEVGDTTLQLQVEPNNWRVGDYIVVASTGDHMSQHQNEKVEITAITGNTITFKPALEYRHLGITEVYGSTSLELRAEVGLLTHNIIFRGSINQEFVTNIPACEDGFDPGGCWYM
jgi:hypothetical protein